MAEEIAVWIGAGFIIAYFIGYYTRYLSDWMDIKLGRIPPRYARPPAPPEEDPNKE